MTERDPLEFEGSIGKWTALVLMVALIAFTVCVVAMADCTKASEIERSKQALPESVREVVE